MPRKCRKGTRSKTVSDVVEVLSPTSKTDNNRRDPSPPSTDIDSPYKNTRNKQVEKHDVLLKDGPPSPFKETEMEFRARKSVNRSLTQEEEDDIVSWLRENNFLYDKSSAEFKFKDKKNRTWKTKETELGLKSGDLSSIWYPNMRTQFSKLIKLPNKSGSGTAERTARQQWILDRFDFLRPYLIQLRMQRGSKFAEKRKAILLDETDDVASDSSQCLDTAENINRPKAVSLLASMSTELDNVRGAITGGQDTAAHTGQFLVDLMRQMDKPRMNLFITRVTRMALDFVDESQEEKRRLLVQEGPRHTVQQTRSSEFSIPTFSAFTLPSNRRRITQSATYGSPEQLQLDEDYKLATNIAAGAPPANRTPLLQSFTHLQPPNVQPVFMQQQVCSSPYTNTTTAPTASIIRRAMDVASKPTFSFNQQPFEANSDAFLDDI